MRCHARPGRNGIRNFRDFLEAHVGEANIPLSNWSRLVADLLVAAGLPMPEFEYLVTDGYGFTAYLDLAYPRWRLGLELESIAFHLNRRSFEEDPRRRNRLQNMGWDIRQFTWSDYVDRPDELVRTVKDAIRAS